MGKIPPQAVDLEEYVLGCMLLFNGAREEVPYLLPEHLYKESSQIILQAILDVDNPSIVTVTNRLKYIGKIDLAGGAFYLTQLTDKAISTARIDWAARIIQQHWILRRMIGFCNDTIKEAFEFQADPFEIMENINKEMEDIERIFLPTSSITNIVSTAEQEKEYMELARLDRITMGLTTGFAKFDEYFRFKRQTLMIINGHDNVGKTAAVLFLAVISNKLHKWRWILACMENQEAQVRLELIQLSTGKHISKLTDEEYKTAMAWAYDNFTILRIEESMTASQLVRLATKLQKKSKHDSFLIDPYNALELKLEKGGLSSHEEHYLTLNSFHNFKKKYDCSIWINTHAVTESLRRLHKDGDYSGYPMPPEKADVEGGGKFANRADDFFTIHRYVQHPTEFNVTHIHVRKIKVTQTGGRQTTKDEPIKLVMNKGSFTFTDESGYSPLVRTTIYPNQQQTIQPNKTADNDIPF